MEEMQNLFHDRKNHLRQTRKSIEKSHLIVQVKIDI